MACAGRRLDRLDLTEVGARGENTAGAGEALDNDDASGSAKSGPRGCRPKPHSDCTWLGEGAQNRFAFVKKQFEFQLLFRAQE
jgi:hypothetical protein